VQIRAIKISESITVRDEVNLSFRIINWIETISTGENFIIVLDGIVFQVDP
jgi:hypothetical protein